MSSGGHRIRNRLAGSHLGDSALVLEPEPALAFGDHHTGRDGVDANAVGPDQPGQRVGEADNRRLRRGIGRQRRRAAHPGDRRHVDDRTAAPRLHLRHHRLGGKENVPKIDVDHPVELIRRHLGENLALVVGGVVHQHRGVTQLGTDFCYRSTQGVEVQQIARHEQRRRAALACDLPHQCCTGIGVDIEEGNTRLLGGEGTHESGTDATGAAGDQYDAILEAGIVR